MDRRQFLSSIVLAAAIAPASAQAKVKVVASFSILGDLVREVAGDAVDLTTLVGADQDAHVFEPSPADARALAAAQVAVVNGLGFEGWLDRLVKASGFKGVRVVASEGVKTIRPAGRGGHSHAHGHSHGGGADPHIWQDPQRVQTMVRNIARGLAAADPTRAALFEANASAYVAKLAALEKTIANELAAVPKERRKVITSHDAFAY